MFCNKKFILFGDELLDDLQLPLVKGELMVVKVWNDGSKWEISNKMSVGLLIWWDVLFVTAVLSAAFEK